MSKNDEQPRRSPNVGRREFITGAATFAGYSIFVKAPQALATDNDPFIRREDVGPRIDELAPENAKKGAVSSDSNMHLVELQSDILVAGGGLAGICAAISAARLGSRVILVQDRSRLGGNSSSEVKMHPRGSRFGFREGGIIEEICLENAYHNEQYSWEIWDLLLYDKVIREPNIKLLLDTAVYRVEKSGDKIQSVWARCDKTEHLYHINSEIFVDSTGDSRLGMEAGAEFRIGRESWEEYGEPLADYDPPGTTQGSSILFTAREHDREMPYEAPSWARSITADDLKLRSVDPDTFEYGYWWIELGGVYDTIRDNERLRFELLSIILGVWNYIKNSGQFPKAKNWALETVGMIPGKRDSRRLMGDAILTQHDVMGGGRSFSDGVAFGGWSLDDHPAKGFDASDRSPAQQIKFSEAYNIPFGSLYSKNVENLLMAGRNISASHVAFSSIRVMLTCAVIGQATGTAAHQCCASNLTPRALRESKTHLVALQQQLLRDGAHILRHKNEDKSDLAQNATATASVSVPGFSPSNILSGQAYDKPDEYHNRWMAPLGDEKAWIQLDWARVVEIDEIQIIHDTGLHRDVTMTSLKWLQGQMISGFQPETIRNYQVIGIQEDGKEVVVAEISDNYQRLRRHFFDPVEVRSVRIQAEQNKGESAVGIYEVRAYGPSKLG